MTLIDAGRLIARALKKEGVEQVWTLVGEQTMPILYGCRAEGIKVIDVRHENDACHAADAYARVSGRPGVLVTTAGPGITNTCTAMAEAKAACTPLLHIGGASPLETADTFDLQSINTFGIMSQLSVWSAKILTPARAVEYVSMAFRYANAATPGPVYLEIPSDIAAAQIEDGAAVFPENYRVDASPFGDPEEVKKAADILLGAERPVFVLGDYARYTAQYREEMAELINYMQVPTFCQPLCRGLFADESENILFTLGEACLPHADAIFTFGALYDYRLGYGRPPAFSRDAKIVSINADKRWIGLNRGVDAGIVGGATAVAKQILGAVKAKTAARKAGDWAAKAAQLAAAQREAYEIGFNSAETPMHPGRCAAEVAKFLNTEGRDWTVGCDGGDASQWIYHAVIARRPGQILRCGPLAAIGSSMGFSLGAYAASKAPFLYYVGDGSFGFYPMDFDTLARHDIPVVCVISNDSAWGMIKLTEERNRTNEASKGHVGTVLFPDRDYHEFARVWGGVGKKIIDYNEIVPGIREIYASGRPGILNCIVDHVNMSPFTAAFVGRSAKKK
jgi:acetolactate synthase-1/2/3 large subunit